MRNKAIAYTIGISCHVLFAAAVALMAYMLFEGLTRGIYPLGEHGRAINILLLLQFPVLHSFLLSKIGRRLLESPFPRDIARDLSTTTFSLISSLQLLVVFLFWTPNREIWFAPRGTMLMAWELLYAASWLLLVVALAEAGMSMHTGALGWRAVVRGDKPRYPKPCQSGLHGSCRHPIYLAFALIILTAPVWSFDHFVLAIFWVAYCLIGPRLKERRQRRIFGPAYDEYAQSTPYFIPRFSLRRPKADFRRPTCERN